MNLAPLTRRELRERERAQAVTAAAESLNSPAIGLTAHNLRSAFATISIGSPEPMTLAVDQAPESPVAAFSTDNDAQAVPVIATAPIATAAVAAVPTAAPTPALPTTRRALRLAAEKAAAESLIAEPIAAEMATVEPGTVETVTVETMTVETVIVATDTVASDALTAGPASVRPGFGQEKTASVGLLPPMFTASSETAGQGSDADAPAARRAAKFARVEAAGKRDGNIRPAVARTAPRSTAGAAPRPPAGPTRRPAKSRTRKILAKGFPLVAMTFVAGLMIATTTPAAALLSQSDLSARSSIQFAAPDRVAKEGTQSYTAASGDTLTVVRDGYETSSVEKIAQESGIRMEATYTNNPNGTIQWPFPVGVHIGDEFGYRNCAGCSSNHRGQDFNPGDGAPIQSIADGVVRIAENGGGSLGVYMLIDHKIDGRLISSVYAHMQYDTMKFEVGDTVKVGEVIGITGTTGMSTGPHLHFEIRLDGVTNVDPLQWLYNNTN